MSQSNQLRDLLQLPTLAVARQLLGWSISTRVNNIVTSGIIVETEAYHQENDPACHAHRGVTPRTKVMFDSPGTVYVYLIYGMYFCVNIVTEAQGTGAAVLLRALEPTAGQETMYKRRRVQKIERLCSGPGKLCQALAIDKKFNGEHLLDSKVISLKPGIKIAPANIVASSRIGISSAQDLNWRFFIKNNGFVSRK